MSIEIIVGGCVWSPSGGCYRRVGLVDERTRIDDPAEAKRFAFSHRKEGMSVIIRPTFNEAHIDGNVKGETLHGYREWRSFDGKLFEEVHFFMGSKLPISMVRLDQEVILPESPEDYKLLPALRAA